MSDLKSPSELASRNPVSSLEATTVAPERLNFKKLLLANPNHFGTFPNLGGTVVLPKSTDTAFEEVTCLGLSPQQDRLAAVVNLKQHSGYGTDGCGAGSKEYVRFFVQRGAVWYDAGVTSVDVYNIAGGPLPLSYAVSVDFDEARKFCVTENVLNVRAILSWSLEPPPGNENFLPPWGNVINARVQVAPLLLLDVPIATLVSEGLLKPDPTLLESIDLNQKLAPKAQSALGYDALKALYSQSKIPGHRFGFVEVQNLLAQPVLDVIPTKPLAAGTLAPPPTSKTLAAGAELAAILAALDKQSGDTTYEELKCAGFNPQTRELEAVIEIKRNAGYSGGLCTPGSTEYVSFFAFFNSAWQPLGTATVQVHDLAAVSTGASLMYAARRISNLTEMPCETLAGVPLRAILSWQQQPTGPDFTPFWGNVVNTNVQPVISDVLKGDQARLFRVGGVTIDRISDITHLAYPRGLSDPAHGKAVISGDCSGDDSPFGGELQVEGDFYPRPNVYDTTTGALLPGGKPVIYQVWVQRVDVASVPFQLTNQFYIAAFPLNAPFPPVTILQQALPAPGPVTGGAATDVYYFYRETDTQAVNPRTLVPFESGGLDEGDYQVEVRPFFWTGLSYVQIPSQFKTVHVFNGYPHSESGNPSIVKSPEVSLTLNAPFADCGDVTVGATITGSYQVIDRFFRTVSIGLVPITIMGNPAPENAVTLTPDPGAAANYDGSNTFGSHGTFSLNTTGMTPCGYTVEIVGDDRAIVDSHCYDHQRRIGVGFCLRKA